MYVAEALQLREGDRSRLESLTRASGVGAGWETGARIVLLAAEGVPNTEIAVRTQTSRPTVLKWRGRYGESGIDGLADEPRAGPEPARPPVAALAHGGGRLMADRLGISFASVARIWRKWNIQPHRVETFKFSTDPELEAKLRDVRGSHMDPPP